MHRSPVSQENPVLLAAILIILLTALPLPAGAAPIYAVQGEDIPLGGMASGSFVVYLFLTGPNLPPGGISLSDGNPVVTGDPGSFTGVDVNTDGTWAYTWSTGSLGRILDPGTYTIYITQEPLARPDLDDTVYATEAVIFGAPVETVTMVRPLTTAPLPPGTMQGGPLVTGMETASVPPQTTGTIPPTTAGRSPLSPLLPLVAGAFMLWSLGRR